MRILADIGIIPLGVGLSLSPYVAACEKILAEAGLNPQLHPFGTTVEGEWDDVFTALKHCHEKLHAMGAPRITAAFKVSTRIDKQQSAADKVRSVKEKLAS